MLRFTAHPEPGDFGYPSRREAGAPRDLVADLETGTRSGSMGVRRSTTEEESCARGRERLSCAVAVRHKPCPLRATFAPPIPRADMSEEHRHRVIKFAPRARSSCLHHDSGGQIDWFTSLPQIAPHEIHRLS